MEILQFSTFSSRVMFVNLCGNTEKPKSFTFTYSTLLSQPFMATCNSDVYANCRPTEGGVVVNFVAPKFNVGKLTVRREMELEDEDGSIRHVVEVKELDYTIVQSYSHEPEISQTSCDADIYDGFMINETVEFDVVEGPQGEPGASTALDYSFIGEQLTSDWFLDVSGNRAEVYTRTIAGVIPPDGGVVSIFLGDNTRILSLWGHVTILANDDSLQYFPPACDEKYYWNYSQSGGYLLLVVPTTSSRLFGKNYNLVVKYTK